MNALEESAQYAKLNPPKRRRRVYSHTLNANVEARIPPSILEALSRVGWNALGIYEVVQEEIKKEKAQPKE